MPAIRQSPREKVKAYRARVRAQGLRPVRFWIPDVRNPAFVAEARRQPLAGWGPLDDGE
ncbi:antitoxin MazE-like protein [Azospirillum sp. B510]|uniref:antitoxin MazE-like protein n=1 Tax=Azospirillum sp. (strain B510) TaxID=137722 RepID=UPI00031D5B75|nr:antitoxin MazE-like protein [Azospirillum sp. B510]